MLTFLNSYILPALSLAALPILIHLLTRHKVKEQKFSDLRFLAEIHRKRMRRMRIRQWLILILRTLIILFVVSAFARPTIRGVNFGGAGSHEKTAVAIMIDNSYSTGAIRGGTDVLTFEKAAANKILSLLEEGDAAIVGVFNDDVHWLTPKPSRFFPNLSAMLDTISVSDRTTDIPKAILKAQRMLQAYTSPNKEIYILTDDAACGWHSKNSFDTTSAIPIYILAMSADRRDNRTIVAAEFPPQLIEIGTPFNLSAVVKNNGKAVRGVVVSLVLDGKKTSQTMLDIPSGAQVMANLTGRAYTGGFHWGFIESSDDNLPADNRRYLTFRIPRRINVLIVGEPQQRKFFKLALTPEGEKKFFYVSEISDANLGRQIFSKYDVIVLIDPISISDAVLGRLRKFASEGGGLAIFPGQRGAKNISAYDRMLKSFGAIDAIAVIGDTAKIAQLGWGKANFNHPVLAPFAEMSIPGVTLNRVIQFSVPPGQNGQIFLRFENDMPALADMALGEGRIIIAGFAIDMRWGNLPISGFFVPMAHRICQYLASDVAYFDIGYPVGSDVSRVIQDFVGVGKLRVIFPGGGGAFVAPRFVGGKPTILLNNLPAAGIYTVVSDGDTLDMFAANLVPSEGDLKPLDEKQRKNLPVRWIDPDKNIAEQILSARYGTELWRVMLIIALILMAAEMIIETRWKPKER